MAEDEPVGGGESEPTRVPLRGPNVASTFDTPPRPDAVKVHREAIRRHLRDGSERPPEPPEAAL
ncbi:MAG: hypothetical protein ACLQBB_00960 [Solirubrobacteraceae bacterium]